MGRFVTPALIAALFATWLFGAVKTLRPGAAMLASIAAVAVAAAWGAAPESSAGTARAPRLSGRRAGRSPDFGRVTLLTRTAPPRRSSLQAGRCD